ncbi:MAG TPA: hypothetical protein VM782_08440 [Stellaceae bacterium]|nr:hypothetical protein [Stellaceae bacterium]
MNDCRRIAVPQRRTRYVDDRIEKLAQSSAGLYEFFELVPRRAGAIVLRLQLQDVRHAATLADTFNGKVVGEWLAAAA